MTGTPGRPGITISKPPPAKAVEFIAMESASATPMRIAWVPVFLKVQFSPAHHFRKLRWRAKLPIRLTRQHGSPLNCEKWRYQNVNEGVDRKADPGDRKADPEHGCPLDCHLRGDIAPSRPLPLAP